MSSIATIILAYIPLTKLVNYKFLSQPILAKLLSYKYNINNFTYDREIKGNNLGYLTTYIYYATINYDVCKQSILIIPTNLCLFLAIANNDFDLTKYFLDHYNIDVLTNMEFAILIREASYKSKELTALILSYFTKTSRTVPMILEPDAFHRHFGGKIIAPAVMMGTNVLPCRINGINDIAHLVVNLPMITVDTINQAKNILTNLNQLTTKTNLDYDYITLLSILLNLDINIDK